jgi:hypothetical protein
MAKETNGRMREMVEEINEFIRTNDVSDFELNFISAMMRFITVISRGISSGSGRNIARGGGSIGN